MRLKFLEELMFDRKLKGIIQLFRPELPFAAGVCVVLGQIVALGNFPPLREIILGFMCGFFISGSAIVLNDYFDLEVDKINTPDRPLPAGIVSPSEAIVLTVIATAVGLTAAFMIGIPAFVLCVIFWVIGFLYNWKFKEAGLPGNLMVSSSVAITFILGGIAVAEPWNKVVWLFGLMAFFIDLGEEIAGDAMDIEGDKKRNSKSIAIVRGRSFALTVSSLLFGVVVLISFIPVIFGWLGASYLLMIFITDVLIVVFTTRLLKSKTSEEGVRSMRGIYLGALVGMLAFIIGQIFQ
jgi:geranylgeranylglycerol-phosphate geranylgeranyltransferase